jgi:hypothetical protein
MLNTRTISAKLIVLSSILIAVLNVDRASAQTAWSMPAPWSAQDIGGPAVAGSASVAQGQFTINAAGATVSALSDQITFVYQQVTGDVDVFARVDSIAMANAWSSAGVMIRSALTANSAHGISLVSAGNGTAFQRRLQTGGATTNTFGPRVVAPRWVRLLRVGTALTAYTSANGTTWTVIGSSTLALGPAYVGLAATSQNASATTTAVISQVSVVPLSLPSPQQAVNIGAPAIAGSVAYRQGEYTVRAAGAGSDTSDQLYFVYQQIQGDVEVVARVKSVANANARSRSGVMIRETLSANARHAMTFATAPKTFGFQRRVDVGGFAQLTAGTGTASPGWVRMVRIGSRIEAFQSLNGTTWTSMGADVIPMTAAVYVGLATTSQRASAATEAIVDSLSIVPLGTTPNQPPQVAITAPTDGSISTAGNNLVVSAAASDADGTVSRVNFFAGSTAIGSATTQPYSVTWPAVAAGTYSLTAVAVDDDGATTTSAAVSIRVDPAGNQPPTVTLTAPANGASYVAPATIGLTATASDPGGAVSRVEFYSGTTLLGTDTASPYSFSWTPVGAGTYVLKAMAYDAQGASASSATSTVTVTTTPAAPPTTVVFSASADHATLVTSYRLDVFASGADPMTAAPIATSDLGKVAPAANNDITVNRASLFSGLAPGSYLATVTAIGSAGSTRCMPATAFTR